MNERKISINCYATSSTWIPRLELSYSAFLDWFPTNHDVAGIICGYIFLPTFAKILMWDNENDQEDFYEVEEQLGFICEKGFPCLMYSLKPTPTPTPTPDAFFYCSVPPIFTNLIHLIYRGRSAILEIHSNALWEEYTCQSYGIQKRIEAILHDISRQTCEHRRRIDALEKEKQLLEDQVRTIAAATRG